MSTPASTVTRSGATPTRLGRTYALFAPLVLALEGLAFAASGSLGLGQLSDARAGQWVLGASAAGVGVLALVATLALVGERRRPLRTLGRGRLLTAASAGLVHALGLSGLIAVAAHADAPRLIASGYALPDEQLALATAALSASMASALVMLGSAVAAFMLLSERVRKLCFLLLDATLLAAVIYAVAVLPSRPPEGPPSSATMAAVIRHAITTLALMRLLARALPYLLNLIERIGLTPLIASRHLRSKKSGFLAAISLLSVLAVTVSCMALTTTLSVMGGFRNDLKRKILGNNAHIVIDRDTGAIADWKPLLAQIKDAKNVTGASPYVSGEVMLSSATNLATGVLRGIDPDKIGEVNDLPRNLQAGALEYLKDPQKLLSLPPSLLQTSLLPVGKATLAPADEKQADEGQAGEEQDTTVTDAGPSGATTADAATADASAATREPPPAPPHAPPHAPLDEPTRPSGPGDTEQALQALERRIDDIEAFLREPARDAPKKGPRETLPGIVVGKELARALRLYVGDEVNVVAPLGTLGPSGPMPKARPFRVAGIFYSGMPEYDMKFTYVTLETGQKFLNLGDAISGIDVRVSDLEQAPDAASAIRGVIKRAGAELRVRDWQELNSRLFGALALEKLAMFITLGIAIVVASFCIAGTLTLMVQEKGREVAILKAMGTSDRAVVGVFVIEGGLIGVLGATLGLFLGFMLCFAAEHFGIRMNPEVYYMDRLPVHIDPTELALTGVAAVLLCLAITIYPALLASRLRPIDALRYE